MLGGHDGLPSSLSGRFLCTSSGRAAAPVCRAAPRAAAARAVAAIQAHGVILRALPGDIVGFCPPLVINGDELDDLFDRVEAALDGFAATAESLR